MFQGGACGATMFQGGACGATMFGSGACGATMFGSRLLGVPSGMRGQPRDLGEGDLEFVQRLRAALVDARGLRRGSDEASGEEIGQRRMSLPVGEQRDQQVGTAQQRRVRGCDSAEGDVVSAAGSAVSAVDLEGLGRQPRLAGLLVERLELFALLGEARGGCHVDLDHPGVGRDRHR